MRHLRNFLFAVVGVVEVINTSALTAIVLEGLFLVVVVEVFSFERVLECVLGTLPKHTSIIALSVRVLILPSVLCSRLLMLSLRLLLIVAFILLILLLLLPIRLVLLLFSEGLVILTL